MSEDKPLHVQVAETLGWTRLVSHDSGDYWTGLPPQDGSAHYLFSDDRWPRALYEETSAEACVPCYDTDWSATGPLMEKYATAMLNFERYDYWQALHKTIAAKGKTPLLAVCNLILELKKAGKLDA